jgi:steroid delta-isomerase-like uncharacterized protein
MAGKHDAIVKRYYEKAAHGDAAAIDQVLDPDFVLRTPASSQDVKGRKGYKDMIAEYKKAAPGLKISVTDTTEKGDEVTVRWTATFKHTGKFKDHDPTNKEGSLSGVDRIRIKDGKIVEITNEIDLAPVEKELGFKPTVG